MTTIAALFAHHPPSPRRSPAFVAGWPGLDVARQPQGPPRQAPPAQGRVVHGGDGMLQQAAFLGAKNEGGRVAKNPMDPVVPVVWLWRTLQIVVNLGGACVFFCPYGSSRTFWKEVWLGYDLYYNLEG